MAERINVFSRAVSKGESMDMAEQALPALAVREDLLYRYSKRVLDILLSILLLILLSPLLLIIAIAIRLDSPGHAVFIQRRVGKNGRLFDFYKFRSMHQTAGHDPHREFAHEYINGNHHKLGMNSGAALFKPANGNRVTRIGKILRKTSLDELPQLINILKGDMSLVGPRPSIEYEFQEYAGWHMRRLDVLPGLTGWAQIHGRSALAFDDIVTLDMEYIRNRSLLMDLWILLRTIPVVLSCQGAG